jgi:hypothetical protein
MVITGGPSSRRTGTIPTGGLILVDTYLCKATSRRAPAISRDASSLAYLDR